jgi:hypothetical protein
MMTSVINLKRCDDMRAADIIKTLTDAGFTPQQALGLTSVILGIRTRTLNLNDAEDFLERNGFPEKTAEHLSQTFFKLLDAA